MSTAYESLQQCSSFGPVPNLVLPPKNIRSYMCSNDEKSSANAMPKLLTINSLSSESAVLQDMFRKLACNLCESLITHSSELRIEGTIGITIDGGSQVMLLHFSDRVLRSCSDKMDTQFATEADSTNAAGSATATNDDKEDNEDQGTNISSDLRTLSSAGEITKLDMFTSDSDKGADEEHNQKTDIGCSGQSTPEQRLLRQLLSTPPVLKQFSDKSDSIVPVTEANNCGANVTGEVISMSTKVKKKKSTILGRLLTTQDSSEYVSQCHPRILGYNPLSPRLQLVDDIQGQQGSLMSHVAPSACQNVPRQTGAQKRVRCPPDDSDLDWEPYKCSKASSQKQVVSHGNGINVANAGTRSKCDQRMNSSPVSLASSSPGQYQFSHLLHNLVKQRLSSSGTRSQPSGMDVSAKSSSRLSEQTEFDLRHEVATIKQLQRDCSAVGSDETFHSVKVKEEQDS